MVQRLPVRVLIIVVPFILIKNVTSWFNWIYPTQIIEVFFKEKPWSILAYRGIIGNSSSYSYI